MNLYHCPKKNNTPITAITANHCHLNNITTTAAKKHNLNTIPQCHCAIMNNESRQNSKSSAHKQHGSHVSWLMGQGWYWSGTVSFPKQKNNPHSCLLSHVITSCRPRHHYSCRRRRRRLLVRVAYRLSTIAYHIILSVSYHHRLSVVVVCCRIVVVANRL